MPPAPSISSTEQDEEVAFQVLNQDDLPIAVIGKPILKAFNSETQKVKPNVIVHPTRRIANNLEENKQKPFAKSNGNIINNNNEKIRNNISRSHGNLCHNNSTAKINLMELTNQQDIEKFTKTLDSKLKRLQKEDKDLQQKKTSPEPSTDRKPFVTTVKKGQFLEPPPEIANLIGIKLEEQKYTKKNQKEVRKLYAFASHPRVLSRTPPRTTAPQTTCETAAWAAAKLVGTVVGIRHEECLKSRDFSTSQQPLKKKLLKESNLNAAINIDQVDGNLATIRAEQAERRAVARKKARSQQITRPKRAANSEFSTKVFLRDRLLDINQIQNLLISRSNCDATTQTEDTSVEAKNVSMTLQSDAQIQVHPTDLFDFTTEVQPIVEILVNKTIEEALIEVLEEEEMFAIKEQQRSFLEYMAKKANNGDVNEDIDISEEMFQNLSRRTMKHNYVHNLITTV